jgi:hypothetical protein
MTRASKDEKKAIADTGTALHVSPSSSYEKPSQVFSALRRHLVHSLSAFRAMNLKQSGYSWYAVIFTTKADRDSGARTLNETPFIFERKDMALTVKNFEQKPRKSGTVWYFPSAPSDTPEAVVKAVETLFESAGQMCPDFDLKRYLVCSVPTNNWTVKFTSKVTRKPKPLPIGTTTRLVRKERSPCSICHKSGHISWVCPGYKGMHLSPVLGSRTGSGEAPPNTRMQGWAAYLRSNLPKGKEDSLSATVVEK